MSINPLSYKECAEESARIMFSMKDKPFAAAQLEVNLAAAQVWATLAVAAATAQQTPTFGDYAAHG